MKSHLLATLVLCGLLAFASPGWSLTVGGVTDVGVQDTFLYEKDFTGGGETAEIDWVNLMLGTSFTVSDMDKYDVIASDWESVDASPGIWALELNDDPQYILIKTGKTDTDFDMFLFENNAAFNWAVIALADIDVNDITNIDKISHVGEIGGTPVSEPTTMLLLGSGLLGLWGFRKKFKK